MPTKYVQGVLRKFFELEYAGGVLMILSALVALIFANTGLSGFYAELTASELSFRFGIFGDSLSISLEHLIQHGLMIIFFFVVGLELKEEMLEGSLKNKKQIMLPLIAAIGGMVVPAILYAVINYGVPENMAGWAIPSATDIAFAVCILVLAGGRLIPAPVRIFLLAIAIFDDIGAILIIAMFYGGHFDPVFFVAALFVTVLLFKLEKIIQPGFWSYVILGGLLCYLLAGAGIHATIGGVIAGMAVPKEHLKKLMDKFHPLSTYFVLPLFAFVSAGIALGGFEFSRLLEPLPLGIIAGLFIGKQIGVFGATYIAVKTKVASLPQGANWRHVYAVSILAGIGFTMSLFIGLLGFEDKAQVEMVKLGVLSASLLAALYGAAFMRLALKKKSK